MNYKLLSTFLITLFILSNVFAAAPTVSDLTITNTYTNDLNYFANPIDINATATGADLNADSLCWYQVSTGGTYLDATFDGDQNVCYVAGLSADGTGDFNFSMTVQSSELDGNGVSSPSYYWRDNNAPSTSRTSTSGNPSTVVLTCADVATNTGDGSGCALIYYKVGDAAWQSSASNPTTLSLTNPGNTTVNWYSVDNLDNNELALGTLGSLTLYVGNISSNACSIINLIMLVVAGALALIILVFGTKMELDLNMMILLIVIAVSGVIGIMIMGSVIAPACAIV